MTKHVNCMTKHVNVTCVTKHVNCMTKRTSEHANCMTQHVKWSPFSVLHGASSGQCAAQRICVPFLSSFLSSARRVAAAIPSTPTWRPHQNIGPSDPINSYAAPSPEHSDPINSYAAPSPEHMNSDSRRRHQSIGPSDSSLACDPINPNPATHSAAIPSTLARRRHQNIGPSDERLPMLAAT